ncbi:MAG TPA: peptidoglycan bridge formation glycyltransferase FemA/FemB family protein [Candidatus Limnocylindria bacterium]|nr:peptidoglycan bridge formation glycyltransferase FemA/FemB family protein [Candidatus Limnocylindria bacterium]
MIRFRPAVDADRSAWDAFLAGCRYGDFLHDWAWADVAAFDGQPQRRFVAEEDGALVAIAAAQVRTLPLGRSFWYVPRGPVLDYDSPRGAEWLRTVAIGLRQAARAAKAIAVKLEPRLERGSRPTMHFGRLRHDPRTVQVGQTRLVELADDEAMLASFDKDTRYAVRRADREGVEVRRFSDATDLRAVDDLHRLVLETQARAGFPRPPLERYRTVWRALGDAGKASIFEARHDGRLLASGMLVIEGERSYYLFAGSHREEKGETKRYPSYALQWAMMRHAREAGVRLHDLWGIAPEEAGPEHPWHGVGLFKKGFGGRSVTWAGTWDVVADPTLYRLRGIAEGVRGPAVGVFRAAAGRLRGRRG